ncbi:MAG: ABC transporter ATP-binding protein [Patescibacteria group bacterium]|nr:ABC transporter ATP-binding protein [Patescibacteria group bacterium]
MNKVIEVKNLTKTYKLSKGKTLAAVKGTSFDVYQGEVFGILGPNGAGKTTTLEIIECLKPQTSGTVTVLGFDNLKNPDDIKERIGIQLQQSQYLHHLSLGELLDLFKSFYSSRDVIPAKSAAGGSEPESKIKDSRFRGNDKMQLLKLVDLQDKVNEEFANLSGGQKQRFTIATSLVHEPKILFLDEPTTGLDPKARRDMWQLVKTLNSRGITIILTTHYMEEAEFLCHRVAIMDEGKILEIDEPKKLIDKLSDTTQISFFTDQKLTADFFSSIAEVKKVHAAYPKVILEITSLDKISAVVELLKQRGVAFYGFTVKTATLEDVYLDLTGKEYEE